MNKAIQSIIPTVNPAALQSSDSEPTMSSKEFLELLPQKRHDNIKRTMETLRDRYLITFTQSEEPTEGGGKPVTVYHVNKRDSYVVMGQLSPEFMAALVDRWQELEAQALQLPDFTDPAIAARAWADEVEQKQLLQTKITEDAPKVAYVEEVIEQSEGLMTLGDYGRVLKDTHGLNTGPRKIFEQLRQLGIFLKYRVVPLSRYIDRGYFVVNQKVVDRATYPVTFVTGKGQLWIQQKLKEASA